MNNRLLRLTLATLPVLLPVFAIAGPTTSCNVEIGIGPTAGGSQTGSTCQIATNTAALVGFAGPGSASAMAEAGLGFIRVRSESGGGTGLGTAFAAAGDASAQTQDSFVVSGLSASNVTLTFGALVEGTLLSSVTPANRTNLNGLIEAAAGFTAHLSLRSSNGTDSSASSAGCVKGSINTVSVCNGFTNVQESELVFSLITTSIVASNGDVLTGLMSMETTNLTRAIDGEAVDAAGNFGNTMLWEGLQSMALQNGAPYTGAIQLTADSGFDYTQAATETAPEPGTWLLAGFGVALAFGAKRFPVYRISDNADVNISSKFPNRS